MRTAQQAAENFTARGLDKIAANSQAVNTLSNTAGIMGGAMVAAAGAAVLAFANFDEAMSSVQASTMESADNMELLRDAAIDAGQRTAYSATEAAAGIEELAKAGISTADILGGGLDGALDLAAAGGIGVAEAAETAASAMTQFGLAGEDVTHIADLLAAGAGKAQGGVSDMAAALNQSGLVASQMGLSLDETVGSLTAFASAGLVGSDAGTAFRSAMLRLANPTKENIGLIEDLGLRFYDAQGDFVGMESVAGQLQDRLAHLTEEQRNAALAQIFGQDAIRAASILYEEGAEGVREWTDAVNDSGYAAEVAATRMDNLKGDWEEFTGALETALIGAGEGADGPLRSLVQGATDVVNAFSDLPSSVQQGLVGITGAGGLVLLGTAGLGRLVTAVSDVRTSMQNLGISAKTAGIAVAGVGAALSIATVAVTAWASAQAEARARVEALRDTFDDASSAITEQSRELVAEGFLEVENWANRIGYGFDSAAEAAEELGIDLGTLTDAALGDAEALAEVNTTLDEWRSTGEHADAILLVSRRLEEQRDAVSQARDEHGQIQEAVGETATAQGELGTVMEDTTGAVEDQTDALDELIDAQSTLADIALSLRDAQRNLEQSYDDLTQSIKDNGDTFNITTEKGRANQAALDDIAGASWDLIEAMAANGASQEELQAKMAETRDDFIEAAVAAGIEEDAARALADQLNLIPSAIETAVAVTGIDTALSRLGALDATLNSINGKTVTAAVAIRQYGQAAMATGGAVIGPGTGTSDDVPIMASNGEHMLTAAEVEAAGGHGAIYAMRAAIRSGAMRGYRDGGAVQYVPSFASGGAVSASATRVSLEGMRVRLSVGEREFTGYMEDVANGRILEREHQARGIGRYYQR
ncbi:phage tail tape measure protein [Georgenia satyanarayanai]|nr:phage tail tape measure protein [Georgenia satyanarayanai]